MPRAVILTALLVEYLAVRTHLEDLQEETHSKGTIYERGRFVAGNQTWEVGIVEIGAGNPGAALEAERAIAYFNPDVILFVGVAGGIKDVALGDVVASTKVYGYQFGKAEETFRPRPEVALSSYGLEQRARAEARKTDWLQRLPAPLSPAPRVYVAPIAAGERVVASVKSEVFQFLKSNYGDAIAVEMESLGFLEAARANKQVSALVIRGISDLIYNKTEADKEGYQKIAANHASAFAFELLAKYRLGQSSGSTDTRQATPSPSQQAPLSLNLPNSAQDNEPGAASPKVFISYSHDSQVKERVLALADRLREDGIDSSIDQYEDSPPEGWQRWMLNQVEAADYALIVCTQQYDRRFRGQEEVGKGKGVTWEGGVIIQELYDAQGQNSKFIPVTFTSQDSEFIPSPLRSATFYRLDTVDGYKLLYRRLTNQPRTLKPELGKLCTLSPRDRKQTFQDASQTPAANNPADFVLVVCTEQYSQLFAGKGETIEGQTANWQGAIITQTIYDSQANNTKFIPIAFSAQDFAHIPVILRSATSYAINTDYEQLYRRLTNQFATPMPALGAIQQLPCFDHQQFFLNQDSQNSLKQELLNASKGLLNWRRTLGENQQITRPELAQLTDCIEKETSSTTIVLGSPGCGKSALMATLGHWAIEEKYALFAIKADYLSNTVN